MIARQIDWTSHRVLTWTGLTAASVAAWIALMALHGDARFALETLAALCLQIGASATLAMYPAVLIMWLLMSVAMMLPTALPTIDLYVRLSRRMEEGRAVRIVLFVAGYLVAWGVFGAIAAAAQVALGALPDGLVPPLIGAGALLVAVGAYQLSPIKQACLDLCRNPLLFLMSRWREDLPGTLGLGVQHGVICIGCCWALMLLMFASGAMNLVWMALLGLVMLAEKLLFTASSWRTGGGALLMGAGVVLIASHLI
jgi:predicted metal-binding membrane protein